jgi:hypothetical protein
MRKTLVSLVFLTISLTLAFGQSIQPIEAIKIAPEAKVLDPPKSFCFSEQEIFLFPDTQAGKIKVLEKNGNLLKCLDEFDCNESFIEPRYCFYSQDGSRVGVLDYELRKGFIFKRERTGFRQIKTFECEKFGYDIKFAGDGIQTIVSGYITDNQDRPFDLYSINSENGQIDYLLASPDKYGLPTHEAYVKEYFRKQTLPAIGIKGFFDVQGDDLFYIWEGNFRIIKFNLRSKTITKVFGQETRYYVKPDGARLSESYKKGDFQTTWKLQESFSYVTNIFVTASNVYVLYEPLKKNNNDGSTFRIQTYTIDGNFIKEQLISGNPGRQMSFDKTSNELYALTDDAILKYKISR